MSNLAISYPVFKSLIGVLKVYYTAWPDGSFTIYCFPSWGDTNQAMVISPADIADFEAAIKPTATAVPSSDDAAAIDNASVGGRRAVKVQPFSKDGRNYSVVGQRMKADLNAISIMDVAFPEEREVQGASIYVSNVTDGDFMDFFAMGPFGPGGSLVPVLQWGKTIYAKEKSRELYQSADAKTIPAGIVLRLVYTSVGLVGPNPIAIIDLITWV
jgi:hypothetical protein